MSGDRKVIDYTVMVTDDREDLSKVVCRKLSYGWQPLGSSYITGGNWYAQTMVKYEDKEDIQ